MESVSYQPRNIPWYSFLLEAGSTPAVIVRSESVQNLGDSVRNQTLDIPARGAVPEPTVPPRTQAVIRGGPGAIPGKSV
jgi:hypothetical protein